MSGENKFLIGTVIVTLILIAAGIIFFSKGSKSNPSQQQNFDQAQLIQDAKHSRGTLGSAVTIVEFADLQCPACQAAQPIINQTLEKHSQNIHFVFRHFPLTSHKNSTIAAKAAESAANQGKFFEMIDSIYENQKEWEQEANPRENFQKYASDLALNPEQFNQDIERDYENINADYALGNKAGVQSTPTFFINGQKYTGVIQAQQLEQIIGGIIRNQDQK